MKSAFCGVQQDLDHHKNRNHNNPYHGIFRKSFADHFHVIDLFNGKFLKLIDIGKSIYLSDFRIDFGFIQRCCNVDKVDIAHEKPTEQQY